MARFDILVMPRASRAAIGPMHDGRRKVFVTAPAVEGAANTAVIELLAAALGVRKADITLTAGQTSRRKTLDAPLALAEIDAKLAAAAALRK